jgi:hypothetical protein
MRGRLYPQPRQRYERFRLNPYSPLYQGLAFFISVPPVAGTAVELHGPYALPGRVHNSAAITHRFFPEIGRAAITAGGLRWIIVLPPQEVIILTATAITDGSGSNKLFLLLYDANLRGCAYLGEWGNGDYPEFGWGNVDDTSGYGNSPSRSWPLNAWFTISAIYSPGSVRGYISNWGIISANTTGTLPTIIRASRYLEFAGFGSAGFVTDGFVHLRELSLTELRAISDLGNVDYRMPGEAPLILPVRTYWPSVLPIVPSYLKRRSLGARSGTREAAL